MNFRKQLLLCLAILVFASCNRSSFVLTGEKAYNLKQYSNAPELLEKDFQIEKDPGRKSEIAFQIGESYSKFNQYAKAEIWYKKAAAEGKEDAVYQQGKMLMAQEKYTEAIEAFKKLAALGSSRKAVANREIKNCENAVAWKENSTSHVVINIEEINSPTNDFAPIIKDGKLYFSSSRTNITGDVTNVWTGEKNADIFYAEKTTSGFLAPKKFSDVVNTDAFEGTCAFNSSGDEFYFTRCATADFSTKEKQKTAQNEFCHIFFSKFNGKEWSEAERLPLFPDTVNIGHPALSKDGKTLFVSVDALSGYGGKDIYYFIKTDTGWSVPHNAGKNINSSGDEMFPWIDERGNLYFASNGLPSMGGLDIFKSVKTRNGFEKPENLKSPINSGADDFGYIIEKYKPKDENDTLLSAGYFSSNRKGGKGGDDVYRFEEKWVNYYVLKGKVETKRYEDPENPDSKILGLVPLDKVMIIVKSEVDSFTLLSNPAGLFTTPLKAETDYKLTYYKPDYFAKTELISTKNKRSQDSVTIIVPAYAELDKIFPQKEIVIPNIYYDYNKATLRPESKLVLDSILVFFSDNKDLKIEIGSHTDSRGSDEYNAKLSQARAQSVVDYLILKGVDSDRLVAHGYGESKLVNGCANGVNCAEEDHQRNRRTTFRIIGSKQVIESVTPDDVRTVPKE